MLNKLHIYKDETDFVQDSRTLDVKSFDIDGERAMLTIFTEREAEV